MRIGGRCNVKQHVEPFIAEQNAGGFLSPFAVCRRRSVGYFAEDARTCRLAVTHHAEHSLWRLRFDWTAQMMLGSRQVFRLNQADDSALCCVVIAMTEEAQTVLWWKCLEMDDSNNTNDDDDDVAHDCTTSCVMLSADCGKVEFDMSK